MENSEKIKYHAQELLKALRESPGIYNCFSKESHRQVLLNLELMLQEKDFCKEAK